jgi:hypothetical protein
MSLNIKKGREERLLVFLIGVEDHSASWPNYTSNTEALLDFSCYFGAEHDLLFL